MPRAKQNELVQIQSDITNEIGRDAPAIALGIFGDAKTHPDIAGVSNQQLDQVYRQRFASGTPEDRQWLQSEARRDPQQFLDVAKRIGVQIPPPPPQPPAPPPAAPPPAMPAALPVPAVPPPVLAAPAPLSPAALPIAQPPLQPGPPPGVMPGPPVMPPMPAMATGGVVTQPTVALIGEAGPEAVVPLTPPDPALTAHLGGVNPSQPQPGEIQQYIDSAARARGIDPAVAMAVAYHEGGRDPANPNAPAFTAPAIRGTFPTGSSWWPYQLHYGGPGYEQYGTTAGLGNEFSQQTGYQPGDPSAWRASVDFALDQALKSGWSPWYGSRPAQVSQWQGLPVVLGPNGVPLPPSGM